MLASNTKPHRACDSQGHVHSSCNTLVDDTEFIKIYVSLINCHSDMERFLLMSYFKTVLSIQHYSYIKGYPYSFGYLNLSISDCRRVLDTSQRRGGEVCLQRFQLGSFHMLDLFVSIKIIDLKCILLMLVSILSFKNKHFDSMWITNILLATFN